MPDGFLDELEIERKPFRVHVCLGPNCTPKGSPALFRHLNETIWSHSLSDKVEVLGTSCRDRCDHGPSMNVYPGPVFYNYLDERAIDEIVEEHLEKGCVVQKYVFTGKSRR